MARLNASDPKRAEQLEKFASRLQASIERRRHRPEALPQSDYGPDLPINSRAEDIIAAIRDHQVVGIAGETGSGKSTQLLEKSVGNEEWHTEVSSTELRMQF
ncbi:MAG: hypothetical protein U5R46_19000 [Gammaproteobacteria bacterium]|nr:hypothetical protein [Gammaproteobacteria bacterium]